MFWWIVIVILFVGFVLSYYRGVRVGAPWGMPALGLCALALVAAVIMKSTGVGTRGGVGKAPVTGFQRDLAKSMGEGLRAYVRAGSGIAVLGELGTKDPKVGDYLSLWTSGFWEALGTGWDYSAYMHAGRPDAAAFFQELAGNPEAAAFFQGLGGPGHRFDVIISFAGYLPDDLEKGFIYELEYPPVFAAYLTKEHPKLESWLKAGYIQVAIVGKELELRTAQ